MADDSNLVEFSLAPEATESETPEASSPAASSQTVTVSVELQQHIDNVIQSNVSPTISGAATPFVNQYWQPLMASVVEQHGIESMKWREVVKMLHKFSLYLLPETKTQHPQVTTSLLPALIENMKQTLLDAGLADETLDQQFNDIRFGGSANAGTATRSEAQVTIPEPEIKAEPIIEAPAVEAEVADTDNETALEFVIEDEVSAEQEEVELDLLASQLEAEAVDGEPEPLELEGFDLDADFTVDIDDPDNQVEAVAEPEEPKADPKKPSADELPPLELDLE